MAVNYDKLWIELVKRKMNKGDLREMIGCSSSVIANMGKNEYVSLQTVENICKALSCTPNDILEFD